MASAMGQMAIVIIFNNSLECHEAKLVWSDGYAFRRHVVRRGCVVLGRCSGSAVYQDGIL